MTRRAWGTAALSVAFTLDQLTKLVVVAFARELAPGIEILPVFNLVYLTNPGVSFGMLGFLPAWFLSVVSAAVIAVLAIWLWRAQTTLLTVALGFVIGGAMGNLLDRVRLGAVTDFLDFHAAGYHWPAFNLADIFIVSGVGLLLLDSFLSRDKQGGRG